MAYQTSRVQHSVKKPILETVGATKIYDIPNRKITAISDISFSMDFEDFVIVFGPSGSGKTTLLNVLLGIEKPDIGEVFLKGESFYKLTQKERAFLRLNKFGIIPQKQFWLGQQSVLDNVALPLILSGEGLIASRKKAKEFLGQVGMVDYSTYDPEKLSVGQQQKVAIARALVSDPWIIFADEPTGHLDDDSAREVMELLSKANQEDKRTILMVTHNLEHLSYGQSWFFVKGGELIDLKKEEGEFPLKDLKKTLKRVEKEMD